MDIGASFLIIAIKGIVQSIHTWPGYRKDHSIRQRYLFSPNSSDMNNINNIAAMAHNKLLFWQFGQQFSKAEPDFLWLGSAI